MSDEADLRDLEHAFQEALRTRHMAFLDAHLAEGFTLTTGRPGAEVRTREEWLRISGSDYEVDSFAFDELELDVHGDVGVVRSRYRQAGRMGGADRTGAFRMTDVWLRGEHGDWLLAHRHSTALED
jgi:ketosteroid isomerase-like protein